MNLKVEDILELLDAPTSAPAWPKNGYASFEESKEGSAMRAKARADASATASLNHGPPSSAKTISALDEACKRACAAEPEITKYDIQMGDGDCGEAVDQVCKSILSKLHTQLSASTPVFELLESVGDSVEDMGGSLGAILSIFLTAFSNNLRGTSAGQSTGQGSADVSMATIAKSVGPALETLKQYTAARVGDRTVMDVLIPFCGTLEGSGDLASAVHSAEEGARSTQGMRAKYGRATYVGDEKLASQTESPPDPGAFAAAIFLRGLLEGTKQ